MTTDYIKKQMKKYSFYPSKNLGQNFLISNNYCQRIVDSIDLNENDYVIEIGPGFGSLSNVLIDKTNHISLIEIDKRLYSFLKEKYPNIEIFNENVLRFDFDNFFQKHSNYNFVVYSNLPYNISSKIIFKLLKTKKISTMILLVQKEMGTRIASNVGDEKYNGFSAILSLLCNITKLFDIDKSCFYPAPSVESTLIKLTIKNNIDFNIDELEKFMKICFLSKRKKILNNLKVKYKIENIQNSFTKLKIDLNIRPEEISPQTYLKLMKELNCGN